MLCTRNSFLPGAFGPAPEAIPVGQLSQGRTAGVSTPDRPTMQRPPTVTALKPIRGVHRDWPGAISGRSNPAGARLLWCPTLSQVPACVLHMQATARTEEKDVTAG